VSPEDPGRRRARRFRRRSRQSVETRRCGAGRLDPRSAAQTRAHAGFARSVRLRAAELLPRLCRQHLGHTEQVIKRGECRMKKKRLVWIISIMSITAFLAVVRAADWPFW